MGTIYLAEQQQNADWTKRSWDIHGTVAQQAEYLLRMGGRASAQENLSHFLTLPASRAMPKRVRAALLARGFTI
jgi:hypothetical protein